MAGVPARDQALPDPRKLAAGPVFRLGQFAALLRGWRAESDGTDIKLRDGTPMHTRVGDLFRIAELYGWTGKEDEGTQELATEVARKVKAMDEKLSGRVYPGLADTAIYSVDDGRCIADRMASEGVYWLPAHKEAGRRQNGWRYCGSGLRTC